MPWQTPPIEAEIYLSSTPMGITVHLARVVGDEVRTYAVSPINSPLGIDCDRSAYEWDDNAAPSWRCPTSGTVAGSTSQMWSFASGSLCVGARDCRPLSRRADVSASPEE